MITRDKVGPLKDKGGNLCLEAEDVGKILNKYFASVFTQEKDMEDSEISVEHTNMLGRFEIKKEIVLGLLKSIKVDKTPGPNVSMALCRPGHKFFEEVMKVIDEGRAVDVVYVNFSKAFDKVPVGRLIQKINMHGIHELKCLKLGVMHLRPNQFCSTDTLIRLAELVLTLNNFSFNSSNFLQTKGVAMSTHMSPSYACLSVGYELQQFTNFIHPNLKFTWTMSNTPLPFLDLSVSISGPKQMFHIRQVFSCTSTNLVYCIRCSRCGLLYTGETKCRLGYRFVEHLHSVCDKRQHLLVANHFNFSSHSLGDRSILGLLQCHNDTTHKLEEQHLIFRLGSLQPGGLNIEFTSFKISPPPASSQ
eukprot:g38973.t1